MDYHFVNYFHIKIFLLKIICFKIIIHFIKFFSLICYFCNFLTSSGLSHNIKPYPTFQQELNIYFGTNLYL